MERDGWPRLQPDRRAIVTAGHGLKGDRQEQRQQKVHMIQDLEQIEYRWGMLEPGMKPNEYAVMNRNWRYIRYADGSEELYNVREDPNEWHNLAGHPEMEDVKKKLASSAPETFAEPLKQADYKLVVDGEGFSWEHRAEKDAE